MTNKALRYNSNKPLLSLVPSSLNRYVGMGMTYGALKYDRHNWRKGFNWSSLLDSLQRHIDAVKDGEDIDEESGLPHLCLIGCNVAFLIEHFDKDLGTDDRFKVPPGKVLKFNPPPKPSE